MTRDLGRKLRCSTILLRLVLLFLAIKRNCPLSECIPTQRRYTSGFSRKSEYAISFVCYNTTNLGTVRDTGKASVECVFAEPPIRSALFYRHAPTQIGGSMNPPAVPPRSLARACSRNR